MKFKGFTLAEVLITLAIIGIVAALTIPSVISNYQQQEFKTGLKKAVSVLNEAIQTNIQEEGETPYENVYLFDYLQRHMNIIKTGMLNTCFDENGELVNLKLDNGRYDSCLASGRGKRYTSNQVFYTADGMRFEIGANAPEPHYILHETGFDAASSKRSPGGCYSMGCGVGITTNRLGFCGSYGLINNPNNTINPPCIITVDINGDKRPNPPKAFEGVVETVLRNGTVNDIANQNFVYTYPSPTDKKLTDVFNIMITDEKAIPFGVVAQRAMYSK